MIKRLLAAYRLAKEVRQYYDIVDRDNFWTDGNSQVATSFFTNETGKRLMLRLGNMAVKAATEACSPRSPDDMESGDYLRGKARGVLEAVYAIEQHLNLTPSSAHDETTELELEEQAAF